MVNLFKNKVDEEYGTVLGSLESDWKRSHSGESAIGDFIADAMKEGAHAQVAITNSSGIRKDLSAGPIRKLDLFEISPFRNILCTFTLSGKDVRDFALRYARSLERGTGNLQISGIQCLWKNSADEIAVSHVTVDGVEIQDTSRYLCATSDFVIDQADKYVGMTPTAVSYLDVTVFQALVAKVQKDKVIRSSVEGRFKEIKD